MVSYGGMDHFSVTFPLHQVPLHQADVPSIFMYRFAVSTKNIIKMRGFRRDLA